MKHDVSSLDNKKVKDLNLDKEIFGVELKEDIIYRMIRYQLAKRRSGNHKTFQTERNWKCATRK